MATCFFDRANASFVDPASSAGSGTATVTATVWDAAARVAYLAALKCRDMCG
jgi:hypothetical protein